MTRIATSPLLAGPAKPMSAVFAGSAFGWLPVRPSGDLCLVYIWEK